MKTKIRKIFGGIAALIGLTAAVVALIQTFGVEPLPKATLIVQCSKSNNVSNMFNFLEDLSANRGQVVLLKIDYDSECKQWSYPRYVNEERDTVRYEVNWVDLARTDGLLRGSPKGKNWIGVNQWMTENFWNKLPQLKQKMIARHSVGSVDPKNIELFNGLFITVDRKPVLNPLISARLNVEGSSDQVFGPFSVVYSKGDGTHGYELTPALLDDSTRKRAGCSLKDWSSAKRFMLCPFL